MDLKYVARQLLSRPGHTLAVIACLVIGLVASVGAFSVITSLFYGDMPGIAGRRSLARVFLRYDSPTGSESGGGGRHIVTAPLSFNDFAIMRELPADSALDAIGAEGDLRMTAAGSHGPLWITAPSSPAISSGSFGRRRCAVDCSRLRTTARPQRLWRSSRNTSGAPISTAGTTPSVGRSCSAERRSPSSEWRRRASTGCSPSTPARMIRTACRRGSPSPSRHSGRPAHRSTPAGSPSSDA